MAYYLQFDGVDDYVDSSISTLTTIFSVEIDCVINTGTNTASRFISVYNGTNYVGIGLSGNAWKIYSHGVTPGTGGNVTYDTRLVLRLDWDGSQFHLYEDGSLVYSVTPSNSSWVSSLNTLRLGNEPSSAIYDASMMLYRANIVSGGSTIHNYDPSATPDPSLPVLIDTVGGNHGTLQNFTLPDAYVYYYDWFNEPTDTPDYALKLTTASETVTLPLVGAYDVTVTYADDTTANYTGTGTLVLDGTTPVHIKHIKGADSEGNVYFDGNNDSDVTNLPELIQGKHGVLSGFPAPSGYVLNEQGGG